MWCNFLACLFGAVVLFGAEANATFITTTWTGDVDESGNSAGVFGPGSIDTLPFTLVVRFDSTQAVSDTPTPTGECMFGGTGFGGSPFGEATLTIRGFSKTISSGVDSDFCIENNASTSSYTQNIIESLPLTTSSTIFIGVTGFPNNNFLPTSLFTPFDLSIGHGGSAPTLGSNFGFYNPATSHFDTFGDLNFLRVVTTVSAGPTSAVPEPPSAAIFIGALAAFAGLFALRRRSIPAVSTNCYAASPALRPPGNCR